MLQFLSWRHLSHALANSNDGGTRMMLIQAVYLLVTVAVPAVLLSLLLTTDARRTLRLTPARPAMLGAGLLLPVALLPLTQELMRLLGPFFPELPPDVAEVLGTMQSESLPLWLPLLAFAIAPAVCEELAFRGFILSGMQQSGRPWRPIILSSIAFGAVHLIPQQVFNAALLGLVLGLLAVRSGSLWPGMLFHFVFNGAQLLIARYSAQLAELIEGGVWRWFVRMEASETGETALRYEPALLLICAVVAGVVIHGLIRGQQARRERQRQLRNPRLPVSTTTGEPARI
jgi:sodium transport system permease protein